MTATRLLDADALRAITRLRDLNSALAAHGTAYARMAHERRRLVATLRAAGIPAATIADRAGMSPSTVRFIAHRAREEGAPT
ncbi:helix-turn-helix domain-containing protein [Mycolicibacterium porcinum]|uniref:Helix-turn-helix domain-containing protein n=1 Tax=Mycolicibacterium porcinum TaxID=39693 RepID=A0ABV3V6R9_9MYCO